jgi:hypothetical protein
MQTFDLNLLFNSCGWDDTEPTWHWTYCTRPRWDMIVEQMVERELVGETEVLRENLSQRHFVHHKSHVTWPRIEPDRGGGKPTINCLSNSTGYEVSSLNSFLFRFRCMHCFLNINRSVYVRIDQHHISMKSIRLIADILQMYCSVFPEEFECCI